MEYKEKPKQIDFADAPQAVEESFEPEASEERRRLQETRGEDAKRAPLTKGESIGKSGRGKEIGRKALQKIRSIIGATRPGDQEEIKYK